MERDDYDDTLFKDWSCIPFRMFLEAGKHVLVEYPMALSAKAAHELWEMAEQKGNTFVLKVVNSITYRVAPKVSNSKAGLQSTINHDIHDTPVSEMCQSRI